MNNLDKWVDVRKKQIREATDTNITIKKIEELNCYFTIKEINDVDVNNEILFKNPRCQRIDKNFKVLEYTPIDEKYNVRVFVNDKNEIYEYYLDITDGMKLENGIPYYNDLFLDVIYYKDKEIMRKASRNKELSIIDQDELQEALEKNIISKEQYDGAYKMANQLVNEIEESANRFINRGLIDYFSIKA